MYQLMDKFYFHLAFIVFPLLQIIICPDMHPDKSDNKKHAVSAISSGR